MTEGKKPIRYPIEKIIKSTEVDGEMEYFVKWKGYHGKHNSWEPREYLVGDSVFDEYEEKRVASAKKNPAESPIKKSKRSSIRPSANREEPTAVSRPKRKSVSKNSVKKDAPTSVSRPKRKSVSKESGKKDAPTTRLKRKSVSEKSGKKDAPTTQLKRNSVIKKSGKKDAPTARLKRKSAQKQPGVEPEEMETERPIEQEHVEAPIYRAEREQETEHGGVEIIEVPIEQEHIEAPIDLAEREQEVEQDEVEIIDDPIEQEHVEAPIYRAENEQVTSVLGCRQERDQSVWVMCSFNNDADDIELTPYNVVSQHHPQVLLNFFHANSVYVDP